MTITQTIQQKLKAIIPDNVADLLRALGFDKTQSTVKVTVTGLTAASAVDITAAATKAAATIGGIALESGENLPPIGTVRTLRVTAASAGTTVGTYGMTDSGGTAIVPPGGASLAMGIAKLSDDGTTITFPANVTGFVLEYYPKPTDTQTAWGTDL